MLATRLALKACLASLLSCWLASGVAIAKSPPSWVSNHGRSEEFPAELFLVGFAEVKGRERAVESAKQHAAADLARQISIEIEAQVVDSIRESNDGLDEELVTTVHSRSQLRLDGIRYEVYRKWNRVFAVAILERRPAAALRRKLRDQALTSLDGCIQQAGGEADSGRPQQAIQIYRTCRSFIVEGLDHEAVAAALLGDGMPTGGAVDRFTLHSAHIDERIRAIPHVEMHSVRGAADGLAIQLDRSGIGRGQRIVVAPFAYGSNGVESDLGREIANALETALGRSQVERGVKPGEAQSIHISGSYWHAAHDSENFEIRAVAREATSGRLLASAEVSLVRSAIREELGRPPVSLSDYAPGREGPADARSSFGAILPTVEGGVRDVGLEPESQGKVGAQGKAIYQEALRDWKEGDFAGCASGMTEYLQAWPQSSNSDEAAYRLAVCSYKRGDYRRAAVQFENIMSNHPGSSRVPDALYRQGKAFLRLGPKFHDAARAAFEAVQSDHPDSEIAEQAGEMLKLLR